MDFSKLSLTQAKRLEMESQVKALELEKELEMERIRLAELRKVHYHLAGASEGWEVRTYEMLSKGHEGAIQQFHFGRVGQYRTPLLIQTPPIRNLANLNVHFH